MTKEKEEEIEPEVETELPPEQEDRIVDKVVSKLKEIVLAPAALLEDETEDDETEKTTKEPTSVKEVETDMEAQVRKELAKIKAEDDHAAEHEKLKAEPEREPVMVGRVTRALWGDGS